ncbi:intradiol ring-cleavage dioxygenase [Rhodopseudomonas sp. HC1]|uniref:intradiol ring-cleavage dioxygenase n=1 Tax=Rhodopseudomonas infernalis TaxID=2897386 RepID=UPI001EE86CA7|nr:intradiol ring-cleavage dioxygenase [Rhodopseudomonas infernalis]MCG6204343.1 intradiol ring-cleavage dioxygenase [Rhodopseudomonas infernalis]
MRNFDETTITEAVLGRLTGASDPRIMEISAALVRHLHAFVSEVRPTVAEWQAGIAFLTETGRMCSDTRQEFVLLSDTLGVSMLVDAINHSTRGTTESTVLGPFYVEGAPTMFNGDDISAGLAGEPLIVTGSVRGGDGAPVAGALVDVWHSDGGGFYDVQQLDRAGGLAMRARLVTGVDGGFRFWTIKPAAYPVPHDGPVGRMLQKQGRHPWRPAHVHFMIQAAGYAQLITHIFAEGDPYLNSDVVFGVKDSLIRPFVAMAAGAAPDGSDRSSGFFHLHYDFALERDPECRQADLKVAAR